MGKKTEIFRAHLQMKRPGNSGLLVKQLTYGEGQAVDDG